jgi:hypothetical protein
MLLISKFSKYLKKKEILQIIKLKKIFWKFNLNSQLAFFKKDYCKFDIHNLLYLKKKLMGYNVLKKRSFFVKKKNKYYYLDTLIIAKSQRKKNYGSILMKLNNNLIKNNNLHGMLLCRNNMVSFYKKFGWKIINSQNTVLEDKNTLLVKLFFNNKKYKKNTRYYLYK